VVSIFILNLSARHTIAAATYILMIGCYWPAEASAQQSIVRVYPNPASSSPTAPDDVSAAAIGVPARNRALALTSYLPWRAPIGHRQPRRIDVDPDESMSAWERQQNRLNKDLDRKIVICRRC
jgi:hypothetical protein